MLQSSILSKCATCALTRQTCIVTGFQQVAEYHPPPLHDVLKRRLTHQGLKVKTDLEGKRKAFARFGAASGVNPSELFPTEKEIKDEIGAEKKWWPTLEAMQLKLEQGEKRRNEKHQLRNKKIADNMKKMPEWIRKYREQLYGKDKKSKAAAKGKKAETTKIPSFQFFEQPSHPQVVEFIREKKDQSKN